MKANITPLLNTLEFKKIPDSIYFSEDYKNYISNSRLGLINPKQDGNPEKFFGGFKPFNSPSLAIGSAVHELTLQKDLFILAEDLQKPTAKVGVLADLLYPIYLKRELTDNDYKEQSAIADYYKGNLSEKQLADVRSRCTPYLASRKAFEESFIGTEEVIYLDSKSRQTVQNCVAALNNNKGIQHLLNPKGLLEDPVSLTEMGILLEIEVEIPNIPKFRLRLKSKLDHLVIDKETNSIQVNDIKTIGKTVDQIGFNIDKFRYNREFAMYSWLLSLVAKKFYSMDNPTITGNYLIVSTIPQYYTKIVTMNSKMYQEGWNEFKYLLNLVINEIPNYKDFAIWM